jgi:hypothetical protein
VPLSPENGQNPACSRAYIRVIALLATRRKPAAAATFAVSSADFDRSLARAGRDPGAGIFCYEPMKPSGGTT